MNMNEMALNKNDELKYLILMREEYFKYKLKMYFFHKWRSRALYNRDLIDEEDPFSGNTGDNYQKFKSKNIGQSSGLFDSTNPYINNDNGDGNNFKNNNGNLFGQNDPNNINNDNNINNINNINNLDNKKNGNQ